ncbi:MAG: hypothetical protein WD358_06990 [Nitriliruptoraceae bacterium]
MIAHGSRSATGQIALVLALAAVLAACATTSPDPSPDELATEVPAPPPNDLEADLDEDAARDNARALLGLPEESFEESPMRRIVRRGDEHFAVTMDLRPGRQNVELDDDGSGTYVVTKVVIETMDGDNIVVE